MTDRLTRSAFAARVGAEAAAAPPVRIVHLGLGHFFRAHQAWYTSRAADAAEWGIAAFTGRTAGIADALSAQDGLFTLVERGASGDAASIVTSLVETHPGSDSARLAALVADPAVAVITLTVTESGYRLTAAGEPDLDDALVAADIASLRRGEAPTTALGRLVHALAARQRAHAGGIAVVSCDNIPRNGEMLRTAAVAFARLLDDSLAAWIDREVSFVDTSVDRITPHVDIDVASLAGWEDAAPVVTEPFADWVLSGAFPAGRPDWESAGARFVDDIEPWENRKLWLLNGAHSILTFAGLVRGLETVADAIADPECRMLVEDFWQDAVACLPPGTEHAEYRERLIERFENPRIEHRLAQIAAESTTKVRIRFAAVAERSIADGRSASGALAALATWIEWVRTGPSAPDARAAEVAASAASADPVRSLLALVSPELAADDAIVASVRAPRLSHRVPTEITL